VSRIFEEFQHTPFQTKIVQHFGGLITVRQPKIGRKYSTYTSRLPKNEEIRGLFLYLVAQNSEHFFKIQDQNKKIKNL
jgi:hypothetical protein